MRGRKGLLQRVRYNETIVHGATIVIDTVRAALRTLMRYVARLLNSLSGGRLSPHVVTLIGLLAHIPIAWLIATRHPLKAALLLIVFGLFDALDGELARLQKRAGTTGMLLDSVTDRVKEIILYIGVAYLIAASEQPKMAAWVIAACGASLLVSYVNAWGEVVISRLKLHEHIINKTFRGGLMSYDIRMFVLVLGLVSNRIMWAVIAIAVGAAITAATRLVHVMKEVR